MINAHGEDSLKKLLLLLSLLTVMPAHASFLIGINSGYHSTSDGNTNFTFDDMINHGFIGASVGKRDQLYIGQNFSYQTTTYKTTGNDKISALELGPRLNYYFNADKTVLFMLAWNPYAKGTRTTAAGASQEVSGWSYLAGLGYEIKINSSFYAGASIMYHSLNITKYEVNSTSTTVSQAYTSISPMINMSFRFR